MKRYKTVKRRQAPRNSVVPPTNPRNKTQDDSQEPPKPSKPPANSSLLEKVKYAMDMEDFFRQKSKSAEFQIKGHKREIASLKEQLRRKGKAMEAQDRRLDMLAEDLAEAKKRADEAQQKLADEEARRGNEPDERLRQKLQDSQRESKRYRTALAAAFKLVDGLKDKTTLAQLLAQTDQQLAGSAPAEREPAAAGRAAASMIRLEDSSDGDGAGGSLGRRRVAMLHTPVKRGRERSSEDSDEQPLTKTRKLGNRSSRKIVLDE
ncbi:hypothetical protein MAC_04754 [Metarhizium acridum CQMa 102]|uniref:Uncharacterized protein n=1 Tax=Metarhizium acridum (strain CQMa 102) TaxID=655827 RepID=E9E4F6_METAQ|nr:uncharacterized protein MAC_04754 [Metarhizium acridum CQMa 102]EFY89167.1 hypothetical protein MAC_04754 [Metarhizium acridum CQMa 102]